MQKNLFVEIGFGQQTFILRRIKNYSKLTWGKIAKILKVNKSMVFQYLRETSRIPFNRLISLCTKINFDLKHLEYLQLIELNKNNEKEILKPKLDEELAEFLGAMAGDGNIYGKNSGITITCNAIVDYNYVTEIIKNKFQNLFGLKPSISSFGNRIQCRVYSKNMAIFLNKKLEFPIGRRKNRTYIPSKIINNKKFKIAYLRGLFDTDGSPHRKRENSGVVEYISCSPAFLTQIKEALRSLDFTACLSGKSVYIYDQKQVDTFFKLIKPSNIKHALKYRIFKETGKVPFHKEIISAFVG